MLEIRENSFKTTAIADLIIKKWVTDEKAFFVCIFSVSTLILYWVSPSLWISKLISVNKIALMLKILTIVLTADYEAVS